MECIKFIVRVFTIMIIGVVEIVVWANIFLNPHCIKKNLNSSDIYKNILGVLQIIFIVINIVGLLLLESWAWR